MTSAGCAWVRWGLKALSLVLLLLAGCSSSGGDSQNTTDSDFSRVILQLDVANLSGQSSTLRTASPAQLRQTELITRIEVVVTGEGIDLPPISCPLSGTLPPECTDNSTADKIIITVNLMLPTGSTPTITVTAFASNVPLYEGQTTTTLDNVQETVTILLALVEIRQVLPQDLANKTFVFPDGAAFGFPGSEVTLQFLSFSGDTGFFIMFSGDAMQSGGLVASGEITLGSCFLLILESTFPVGEGPQVNDQLVLDPCEIDLDGRLRVTSIAFDSTSVSNPAGVNLSISSPTVVEGDSGTVNAQFDVTLAVASAQPVSVDYATADGTAVAGSDYQATSGTLTFDPGETAHSIPVVVNGDTVDEIDEVFLLVFSNPVNAAIFPVPVATGTIQDDDVPPTVSVSDTSLVEGNSGTTDAVFTVTLSAPSNLPVSVDFATTDGTAVEGTDYLGTSGTLNFAPGTTSRTIAVQVSGDVLDEPDETLTVDLSNPTNATIADAQGIGTITDDDPPPTLSIDDVSIAEGDAGTTNMTFTVTLSSASSQQVMVYFATADGTATVADNDYVAIPMSPLSFAPGSTMQTIAVQVSGDVLDETDETFFVNLSNPAQATIADAQGVGTITDDDPPPTLSINDVMLPEGDSVTTPMVFTVTLSAPSSLTVTVDFATTDGSATESVDYQGPLGALTFVPGQTSQMITVQAVGDATDEPDETFSVDLSNPTNATTLDGQGAGTIQNDDTPLSIDDVTVTEGDAGTTNAVFTVSLAAASSLQVTVDVATADDSATVADNDYGAIPAAALTFAPGTTSQAFTVQVNGDTNLNELDETFFVDLSNAVNAKLATAQGVGTITNDDFVLQSISPGDYCLREVDPGDGSTVASVWIKLAGYTVQGGNGLAWDPITGELWALLKIAEMQGRQLVTIDPATGVATLIGDTGDRFAGLAFDDAGNLYGVTGNSGMNQHSLFMLSTANATPGLVCPFAAGDNGEALAFNPLDGLLYRASGGQGGESSGPLVFESLAQNPFGNPCPTTAINPAPILDDAMDFDTEVNALTHHPLPLPGEFLWAQSDGDMFEVMSNGNATLIGQLDHQSKGLTFNPFTVIDDLCEFSLSIDNDVTVVEGDMGPATVTVSVRLVTPINQTVTVNYATADGTATAGNDYVAVPTTTLTFMPNETFKLISIFVNGDLNVEGDETFTVNLSNPSANAVIADGQLVVTIQDNDGSP